MPADNASKNVQACFKALNVVLKAAQPDDRKFLQAKQLSKLASVVKGLIVPWRKWHYPSLDASTVEEKQAMAAALTVFLRSAFVMPAWQSVIRGEHTLT